MERHAIPELERIERTAIVGTRPNKLCSTAFSAPLSLSVTPASIRPGGTRLSPAVPSLDSPAAGPRTRVRYANHGTAGTALSQSVARPGRSVARRWERRPCSGAARWPTPRTAPQPRGLVQVGSVADRRAPVSRQGRAIDPCTPRTGPLLFGPAKLRAFRRRWRPGSALAVS